MEPMNRINNISALRSLALAGACAFTLTAFTGCMTNEEKKSDYSSDGQAAYMTSETDQMGQVYGQISGGAAEKTSALDIVITGELVVEPFAYKTDCGCFVRQASYSGMQGYERDRLDSVRLFDTAGAPMDKFRPAQVGKIIHSRNVTKSKNGKQADIRFDITIVIKNESGVPGIRKGVWNGTMTGSYNGQEFKNGAMTNVVRKWENGRFHFPEAGTIELSRPVFDFLAEFLGDGKAKITIKNKVNKKVHVIWVDANYKESDPADAP
jgi:hypothetical protein